MCLKKIKQLNIDERLSLYILGSIIIRALNIVIKGVVNLTPFFNMLHLLFFLVSYFLLFVFVFFSIDNQQKKEILFFEFIGFALLLLSCYRYPDFSKTIFIEYSWIIITLIPCCYFTSQISNLNVLCLFLYRGSYLLTIICSFLYFFHIKKGSVDMVFSYLLLLPYLLHMNGFFKTKNKFDLLFLIIETYFMITYASRGAFACIIFYILFYILINLNPEKWKSIFKFSLILLVILLLLYFTKTLDHINDYLIKSGHYNRTLDMLVNGNIFYNNGRFDIYNDYLLYIAQKPIFGWGIGADKVVGYYPHNIFIEVFFNFGFISLFIFGIILLILIKRWRLFSNIEKNTVLIFISCGLIPLIFSGTYLEWINFWIFLGFVFNKVDKQIIWRKN